MGMVMEEATDYGVKLSNPYALLDAGEEEEETELDPLAVIAAAEAQAKAAAKANKANKRAAKTAAAKAKTVSPTPPPNAPPSNIAQRPATLQQPRGNQQDRGPPRDGPRGGGRGGGRSGPGRGGPRGGGRLGPRMGGQPQAFDQGFNAPMENNEETMGFNSGFGETKPGAGGGVGAGSFGEGFGAHRSGGVRRGQERHSGTPGSGPRPGPDKRGGFGKGNWGTAADELAGETEPLNISGDKKEEATGKDGSGPEDADAGKEEAKAEEKKEEVQLTLDEWRAKQGPRAKPTFKTRKAGEGQKTKEPHKLVPLVKEKDDLDNSVEYIVYEKQPKKQEVKGIKIEFTGGRRGRVGGAGLRGPPLGSANGASGRQPRKEENQNQPANILDANAFPALGTAT